LIPFTLPGEVVNADVNVAAGTATNVQIVEASPDRVAPRCVHFGPCGGCQYQHMDYPAQVAAKAAILRETLAAAGLTDLPDLQLHAAEHWHYRNRIRLRVGLIDGVLRVGYNHRGSYEMLPIMECPISAPLLIRGAEALLSVAAASPTWSRQLTAVELFVDGSESRLQMELFCRTERGLVLATLCEQIKAQLPQLAGAGITLVGASGRQEQPGARWGSPGLMYPAAGRDYWVSRGSFFQVNRFLVNTLVHLVADGRSGTLAWDLYAGVGLFSRALAEAFTEVVGVETIVGDLALALKGSGTVAVSGTAAQFLERAILQRERPDLIVMDPPRAGLGAAVCGLLGRIKAPLMVYVSCDPETLARDLKAMVDSGYTIDAVHLVDLFPQTFHMETVVVLK
jgi:23S rRNA (uracil1939-C5)-methyltransferase